MTSILFSLGNSESFTQPVQMQLYPKLKRISDFFSKFLKSASNFEYFLKKMNLIADVLPKLYNANT